MKGSSKKSARRKSKEGWIAKARRGEFWLEAKHGVLCSACRRAEGT